MNHPRRTLRPGRPTRTRAPHEIEHPSWRHANIYVKGAIDRRLEQDCVFGNADIKGLSSLSAQAGMPTGRPQLN